MRVKMTTLAAGPNGTRLPGHTYDLPDAEAAALLAGNYATKAEAAVHPKRPPTAEETASKSRPETASTRPARGGKPPQAPPAAKP